MVASELFDICRELATSQPSADGTRRLHEVLVLVCAEGCRIQGGAFGNLFSQVDFLSKRLGLGTELAISLQTARRHTNTGAPISLEDWPYDVMAVAQLVSIVLKEDVPDELLRLLPIDEKPRPKGLRINKEYVRCIVSRVEATAVFANTEEGEISIDYANTEDGRDFAYLRKLLRPGVQLNLLDCHVTSGGAVVVPGQVIVEPDFLIDISSLAACFTNYGHHPLLYTLNRLKPKANTQSILLGNFAGTALDDIINYGALATTAQSLQRSYREQTLQYCACPDFDAQQFKMQAEEQMKNIHEAVAILNSQFSTLHSQFLLEPSFVCERLGLQGRVDLMTADMSLLVEQKAGKNMKIEHQSHDSHGLQLESHYVQLLLYYGVLRYNFGKSDRQTDIRLLYSRYPAVQGLLTVNYYRTLLREALRLRNQIVATELLIAHDGFGRILPLLREDVIYKDVRRDAHFHRYVLPELSTLNSQFSTLNSLERAYFERMFTFVYREQQAQKMGNSETRLHHSRGCFADLWQMPLQEKLETGNILMGGEGGKETYVVPNFRQGDPVYLYSYRERPDACKSILHKGTLQALDAEGVTVVLNNGRQPVRKLRFDDPTPWAVEPAGTDISTSGAIRSLYSFITSSPRRKALLLGQRTPEADTSLRLSRSYHPDYDDVLLKIKQASDYFLLTGPPGTGKTSMALRFIVEEEIRPYFSSKEGTGLPSILLTAYTNRAVDEICAMLCTLPSFLPPIGNKQQAERGESGSFLRLGKATSCDPRFHSYLLDTVLAECFHSIGEIEGEGLDNARHLIDRTPIIVATTSTLQAQPWLLELKHFSLAVVDEASQILEPAIIGLLSHPSVKRFVLIGDHKQLPAVVQQPPGQTIVEEQCLKDIALLDCRQSLFERLLHWEQQQGRTLFTGTLHSHARMHPEVALFPLNHFYQREQLCAVPLPHQKELTLNYSLPARDQLDEQLKTHRLLFLPAPAFPSPSREGESELAEARIVADVLQRIYRFTAAHFDPAKTVGVIVPYRHQIALIRQALNSQSSILNSPFSSLTIDTVERYQGSQRDVIIYSFSISHHYQLDFLTATTFTDSDGTLIDRKLNVALTRARRQMIIVGNPLLLQQVPLFRQLIQDYSASATQP